MPEGYNSLKIVSSNSMARMVEHYRGILIAVGLMLCVLVLAILYGLYRLVRMVARKARS